MLETLCAFDPASEDGGYRGLRLQPLLVSFPLLFASVKKKATCDGGKTKSTNQTFYIVGNKPSKWPKTWGELLSCSLLCLAGLQPISFEKCKCVFQCLPSLPFPYFGICWDFSLISSIFIVCFGVVCFAPVRLEDYTQSQVAWW